jgi:serine/threonine-protein kinase
MRAIMRSILRSRPKLEGVAPELAQICRRAMDPDPARRYEDAGQFRAALQGFLRHRGSSKLVTAADQRAAELREAIARTGRDAPAGSEQVLYDLLGECRFGYRAALEAWPDNPDARAGLGRAITAMIEYELASGDPRAAATLLAGLPDPDPALAARVDAIQADKRRERARLEAYGRDQDPRTGQGLRTAVTFTLGLGWTVTPIVQGVLVARDPTFERYGPRLVMFPVLFLVVASVVAIVYRRVFFATLLNRTVMWGALFAAGAPLLLALGGWIGEVPPVTAIGFLPFLWFCVAALASLSVEKNLWPCAIGYLVSYFASAVWPEHRYGILAAANLVFSLTVWNAWRRLRRMSDSPP